MSKKLEELRSLNKRIFIASLFKIIGLIAVFSRLAYLQIFNRDKFATMADGNRIKLIVDPPERGKIFDLHKVVLAEDIEQDTIVMEPHLMVDFNRSVSEIADILGLDSNHKNKLLQQKNKKIIVLGVPVSWHKITEITNKIINIRGIKITSFTKRRYPLDLICAHVVGYTQPKQGLTMPVLNDNKIMIGTSGIEKSRDNLIAGTPGTIKIEVNALGNNVREIEKIAGTPGQDTTLSINAKMQTYASDLFRKINGSMVVIDNDNGGIAVMYNNPSYDPNEFVSGISQDRWDELNNNTNAPLFNRALSWLTPPASTFKIIIALSALSKNIINRDTKYNCTGKIMVGDREFHCLGEHGNINIQQALATSCNVFFYNVAKYLDIDYTSALAYKMGLGRDPELELSSENHGILPNTRWKLKTHKARWQYGDSMNYVIGQGYLALTPMQLALMISRVATRSKLIPTLYAQNSRVAFEPLDITSEVLEIVIGGLTQTMSAPYGTGYSAGRHGKYIAGKTGTAQKRSIRKGFGENSLFVGFAPYYKPRYSICVVTEDFNSRETKAVYLASKMLHFIADNN